MRTPDSWSYLYYGPISELHQKGLPISSSAQNYMKPASQYGAGHVG